MATNTIGSLNSEGSLYATNFSEMPITTGLVFYIDAGDSGSYGTKTAPWYDISGVGNNVTYYNGGYAPFYVPESASFYFYNNPTASAAQAVIGTAVFDKGILKRTQDEFTIEVVCKITRNDDVDGIIAGKWGWHGGIFSSGGNITEGIWFVSASSTGNFSHTVASSVVNKWVHINYVWEVTNSTTGTMKGYYNGVNVVNTTINISDNQYPTMYAFDDNFRIGGYPYSSGGVLYWSTNAYISIVGCWNRALSAEEIKQNFNLYKDRFAL